MNRNDLPSCAALDTEPTEEAAPRHLMSHKRLDTPYRQAWDDNPDLGGAVDVSSEDDRNELKVLQQVVQCKHHLPGAVPAQPSTVLESFDEKGSPYLRPSVASERKRDSTPSMDHRESTNTNATFATIASQYNSETGLYQFEDVSNVYEAPTYITGSMTVCGVNFAALDYTPSLRFPFVKVCQNIIASAAGPCSSDAQIQLSSGSANVEYTLYTPADASVAVRHDLETAIDGSLAADLVDGLSTISGINCVTSGEISVTSFTTPVVHEDTLGTSSHEVSDAMNNRYTLGNETLSFTEKGLMVEPLTPMVFLRRELFMYLQRVHTLRVSEVGVAPREAERIIHKNGCGIRACQVLCWRRSMLEIASFFSFCTLGFLTESIIQSILRNAHSFGQGRVFGVNLGEYSKHFTVYILLEYLYIFLRLAGNVMAFAFSVKASRCWEDFKQSAKWTARSYLWAYVSPFVLLLVLPFRQGVDIKGIQHHICQDLLDGVGSDSKEWPPFTILTSAGIEFTDTDGRIFGVPTSALDEVLSKGLRQTLSDKFGVELPDDLCEADAHVWESTIVDSLDKAGSFQRTSGQPCRASLDNLTENATVQSLDQLKQTTVSVDPRRAAALCSDSPCQKCGTSTCLQILPTLRAGTAATAAYRWTKHDGPLSGMSSASMRRKNLGLRADNPSASCMSCLEDIPHVGTSCTNLCFPLWSAGAVSAEGGQENAKLAMATLAEIEEAVNFTMHAAHIVVAFKLCVSKEDIVQLQAIAKVSLAEEPWQLLLGLRLSIRSLAVLLPGTFAMMLGAFKGACVAKNVVPYSRIPGLLLTCAVVFSLPFLVLLLCMVNNAIGNWAFLIASFCFLFANMAYLPIGHLLGLKGRFNLLEPQPHKDATTSIEIRQYCALTFNVLLVIWLIAWVASSNLLWDAYTASLIDVDFRMAFQTLDWKVLTGTVINTFCNLYGIAKVSTTFFADVSIYAILLVDEADVDEKDAEYRKQGNMHIKEQTLLRELHKGLDPASHGRKSWLVSSMSRLSLLFSESSKLHQ